MRAGSNVVVAQGRSKPAKTCRMSTGAASRADNFGDADVDPLSAGVGPMPCQLRLGGPEGGGSAPESARKPDVGSARKSARAASLEASCPRPSC